VARERERVTVRERGHHGRHTMWRDTQGFSDALGRRVFLLGDPAFRHLKQTAPALARPSRKALENLANTRELLEKRLSEGFMTSSYLFMEAFLQMGGLHEGPTTGALSSLP
jgi:hypothetical protein